MVYSLRYLILRKGHPLGTTHHESQKAGRNSTDVPSPNSPCRLQRFQQSPVHRCCLSKAGSQNSGSRIFSSGTKSPPLRTFRRESKRPNPSIRDREGRRALLSAYSIVCPEKCLSTGSSGVSFQTQIPEISFHDCWH